MVLPFPSLLLLSIPPPTHKNRTNYYYILVFSYLEEIINAFIITRQVKIINDDQLRHFSFKHFIRYVRIDKQRQYLQANVPINKCIIFATIFALVFLLKFVTIFMILYIQMWIVTGTKFMYIYHKYKV